ncbi:MULTISPECIES: (Fe-S)-binding protein [Lysinibacillus]|uniref:Lactate utilization protein A n=2 Tax=Lysinibacillus TaxID=400634 RepID=A0A2I0UYA7_9BACI|nr:MULTISPECIES: (Fe-S)-binding protein [Lysinibacillus]MEE3808641.1 (Fe-S)-binding protein [Lysinibacillus fusiformis]PKU51037.1 (Fe-S)-binding protein [Lysinibacillus fusiformis]SCY19573.1 L-lactate dehydrogenase complex protein LldE [Lysinibacillus sp. SG9]SDB10351.1 L-lactate dehydrogenase complex protein LldE [Lysinibacillus sp. TC-37]SFS46671.1 L-lactate dehydrogenase complex protein LldE [Lysinibacillus sp. SG55]
MKVTLFATCLVDLFQGDVGKAVVEVLERLGCEIDFPEDQICCGQPAYNSGYVKESKNAMKKMITAFEHAEYVVSPSGSCAYMLKEYPEVFKEDLIWATKAQALADKTYEFTEFIVNVLKINDVGAHLEGKATYHTSCHMTRLLGVTDAPFQLLKNVKGLHYVDLPGKDRCCGFGGTFSVKMGNISGEMVNEKVHNVEETGANILIGADAGCLMNIGGRIHRQGKPIKVMHIAEVLNCR